MPAFLEDVVAACCEMKCEFHWPMAERDLLFHDLVAPHLWERMKYEGRMMKWGHWKCVFSSFITHPSALGSAPGHPIRNRLLRLTADSPDLPAIIKEEGRVK